MIPFHKKFTLHTIFHTHLIFQFQSTASGQTGPGEAAQKPAAAAHRVAPGQSLRLQKMEATTARGLLLPHAVATLMPAQPQVSEKQDPS